MARGRNPYLDGWDGHVDIVGNQAIAAAVAEHPALRALGSEVASREP